jgi:flagellar hook assembly protein FlgD
MAGRVRVEVFSATGQRIRVLHERDAPAGPLRLYWDGRTGAGSTVSPGLYWVRASIGDRRAQCKLVWLGP